VILLDTCVISETLKPEPSAQVLDWIDQLIESHVYLPALVIGELHNGVHLLPESQKRQSLRVWLDQLEARFEGRILSIDHAVCVTWGRLTANLKLGGATIPAVDLLLAALAIHHSAVFATRNTGHFAATGADLVNPWEYGTG
jgi:predicted nucleic acid-binding protein